MYCVTEQQIDYILNDMRRRGLEMEDLQLNLLDHVCCIVEQNLKEGDDFESFYQKTIKQFYKNQLWEIEEETITLLTFKNYYAMKKTMIVSGTTSVVLLLVGSFFKVMHWPGSAPMLILGISIMSFLFLPILFLFRTKESTSSRDKLITGLGALMGILLCMSTMFKVMHWPGASVLWILTSAVSIFVFIPVYFFTGIRKPETKVNTIVTTVILIGGTGLLFTLTSLRSSRVMERFTFLANQDLAATAQYLNEQNGLHFNAALTDSSREGKLMGELKQKSDALYLRIENLKLAMINAIEERNDKVIDYKNIFTANSGNYDLPTAYLFDNNMNPKKDLTELKAELISFNSFIKTNFNKNSFGMINTADSENVIDGGDISWEEMNFGRAPFEMVIRNLTQLQVDIGVIESNCLVK